MHYKSCVELTFVSPSFALLDNDLKGEEFTLLTLCLPRISSGIEQAFKKYLLRTEMNKQTRAMSFKKSMLGSYDQTLTDRRLVPAMHGSESCAH